MTQGSNRGVAMNHVFTGGIVRDVGLPVRELGCPLSPCTGEAQGFLVTEHLCLLDARASACGTHPKGDHNWTADTI